METENGLLKCENAELKAKVANLEAQVAELIAKIVILGGEGDICPHCRKPQGEFIKKAPSIIFKQFGLMTNFYKCKNCGKEYEKQNHPG